MHVRLTAASFPDGGKRQKIFAGVPGVQDKTVAVIVGGGGAAMSCVDTLRQEGFAGRIVMVTREAVHPYDRPKLSKVFDSPVDKLLLRAPEHFDKFNIEVMLNTEVRILLAIP